MGGLGGLTLGKLCLCAISFQILTLNKPRLPVHPVPPKQSARGWRDDSLGLSKQRIKSYYRRAVREDVAREFWSILPGAGQPETLPTFQQG